MGIVLIVLSYVLIKREIIVCKELMAMIWSVYVAQTIAYFYFEYFDQSKMSKCIDFHAKIIVIVLQMIGCVVILVSVNMGALIHILIRTENQNVHYLSIILHCIQFIDVYSDVF